MSAPAIRVDGLGKRYRIGEKVRYKSLRESLSNAVTRMFRGGARQEETIWALKDVSFEVQPGEVVGVIGRNGAGKSTLLKILSRITEPTEGRVELRGRVGSLLEVGTGFHMELTGRENIYLNGAILGMKRAEIDRKFDEIVAFAEIERFLDTPVKHYSTGMYLRLAFAVAAHLEPEILLVDEVLAVGDTEFQKKCLGKMGEVSRQGRTVLFVSHNMGAVVSLCSRCLLLFEGTLAAQGDVRRTIDAYIGADNRVELGLSWPSPDVAPGGAHARLHSIGIEARTGSGAPLTTSDEVMVAVEYWVMIPGSRVWAGVNVYDPTGGLLMSCVDFESEGKSQAAALESATPPILVRSVLTFPADFFNDITYGFLPYLQWNTMEVEAAPSSPLRVRFVDSGKMRSRYSAPWQGLLRPRFTWQNSVLSDNGGTRTSVVANGLACKSPGRPTGG